MRGQPGSLKGSADAMRFLAPFRGEALSPPPIWLMRQAGRYLPEYRATRAKAGSFLKLCYSPELAAEVTLQPIKRYGFDAAILFSDILVVPDALGQRLEFVEGEGPKLEPIRDVAGLARLDAGKCAATFDKGLRNGRACSGGLAQGNGFNRILRGSVDCRDVHGGGRRLQGSGGDAAVGLSRSRGLRAADRSAGRGVGRVSVMGR